MTVDDIITRILDVEGEAYTNDKNDSGGPTKWGVTLDTLIEYRRTECTAADVERLTREEARNVYRYLYILKPGFDKVLEISAPIGTEVIDTGVNCGVGVAAIILQRCLNAFNKRGTLYPDIATDGNCGVATIRSLRAFLAHRGTAGAVVLYKALNSLQGERYIDLCEKRPKDEDWVFGWFQARVGI